LADRQAKPLACRFSIWICTSTEQCHSKYTLDQRRIITAYQKENRLPDIKKVQQFLNDLEVIEKVRNNRDNTEKLERNMTAKRRAKINEGKVTQLCHPLTEPFCGALLVSVQYRPLYFKNSYYTNHLSARGFEFLWKCLMEFVKEANILPG
jgi:hypothetical protein